MRAWRRTASAGACAAAREARARTANRGRRPSFSGEQRGRSGVTEFMQSSWPLERRRRIHPQHPGFGLAGIGPGVRRCAFKIETVAGFEQILLAVERDLELAAQHIKKFLALVG